MREKLRIDRERWLAAIPYLDRALDLPAAELESWLGELEATEPRIAEDVRRLVTRAAMPRYASFLSGQAVAPPADVQYARDGELIGHYRVVSELGRGGMAVVYLAERADGHFEQRVALKILRVGPEGSESQHHFAQERQILASLNHPAIARLIDGGMTAAGSPYLAMEYVDGLPIDRYCDERRLSINDRLKLFMKVAEAVQYAHRHLIVHRDLKPSNIVVTDDGAVKLLDFGIAKLLEPDVMAYTAPPTRGVVQLMTPEYASPEQVRGDAITTATDIYQLGLLIYELLTGQRPYDLSGRKPADALRVICEAEPMRPSIAVTRSDGRDPYAQAAARATTPDRLRRMLRGDLDAIVLMALRKEPERRFASVDWLADNISRYLQGLPVNAYKGVWAYRARKFVRRHAAGVAIATAAACAFALIIVWYTIQLSTERDRAEAEALHARRETATAEQVSEFLSSVFRGSGPRVAKGDTTARELLDRGAERIETELADEPQVQGRLLNVIGEVYAQYEINDKAQPLLERALLQNARQFGAGSKEVADTKQALARVARNRGEFDKAQRLYEETLHIREHVLQPKHVATADALYGLATVLVKMGKSPEAARTCERALDIYTHAVGAADERALSAVQCVAAALYQMGQFTRARAYHEQLVATIERNLGPDHPHFALALGNLASVKRELGEYAGTEEQARRALALYERTYGPNHSNVAILLTTLGGILYETGRFREALEIFERAIATQRRVSGPGHAFEGFAQNRIGRVLRARADLTGALSHQQLSLDIYRKSLGPGNSLNAETLRDYGEIQLEMGNLRAAAEALNEAVAIQRRNQPPRHYNIAMALVAHAVFLARAGMPVEAEAEVREAISYYQDALPAEHHLLAAATSVLGECLLTQGRVSEAEPLLVDSARRLENRPLYERRDALQRLIRLFELKGDSESAERFRNELAAFDRWMRAQ